MPAPSFVLFDTEYTTAENARELSWGGFGQHREIIQIASAIITPGGDWNAFPKFNQLVKPQFTELNAYTTNLTGITQAMMDEHGITAEIAFRDFTKFIGNNVAISNGNDVNVMNETCGLQGFKRPYYPLRFGTLLEPMYAALHERVMFDRADYPSGRVHQLMDIPLLAGLGQVHDAMRDVWSLHVTVEALAADGTDIISPLLERMLERKRAHEKAAKEPAAA